ncbi:NAD(P)H-binding protein [Vibrio sp. Vb339]|uniref:NAD(P)H-binding protein n=1 Tax=Vibrio sp. Vb339 TaxID=1192013 RepID=UPI0015517E1D|nr:NAD(P)H-binding protein [Vibrio sp. Vb339]
MKVAVLGATSTLGKSVVEAALSRGFEVSALIPEHKYLPEKSNLKVVVGNYFHRTDLCEVLNDVKATISCIAPTHNAHCEDMPYQYVDALRKVRQIMSKGSGKRLIQLTSYDANGVMDEMPEYYSTTHPNYGKLLREQARDLEMEYLLTRPIFLDWTLIRVPFIHENPKSNKFIVTGIKPEGRFVDADHLAQFMIEQIDSDEWLMKSPFVISE